MRPEYKYGLVVVYTQDGREKEQQHHNMQKNFKREKKHED
jgi:hypothetical protein